MYKQRKRTAIFILAVVLFLPPAPCPGDIVFRCESETTLFGLPKEDTTRSQRLSCIYNTVPEQFNPNIRVCAAHFTLDATNASFIFFIVFVSSRRDTASQYGKGCNISLTHLNYSTNHNAL